MWRAVMLVVLAGAGVPNTLGFEYNDLYTDADADSYSDDSDLYDHYKMEAGSRPPGMTTEEPDLTMNETDFILDLTALNRVRRYGDRHDARTLRPTRVNHVKDALKQIIYGNTDLSPLPDKFDSYTDIYDYVVKNVPKSGRNFSDEEIKSWIQSEGVGYKPSSESDDEESHTVQNWQPSDEENDVTAQHWHSVQQTKQTLPDNEAYYDKIYKSQEEDDRHHASTEHNKQSLRDQQHAGDSSQTGGGLRTVQPDDPKQYGYNPHSGGGSQSGDDSESGDDSQSGEYYQSGESTQEWTAPSTPRGRLDTIVSPNQNIPDKHRDEDTEQTSPDTKESTDALTISTKPIAESDISSNESDTSRSESDTSSIESDISKSESETSKSESETSKSESETSKSESDISSTVSDVSPTESRSMSEGSITSEVTTILPNSTINKVILTNATVSVTSKTIKTKSTASTTTIEPWIVNNVDINAIIGIIANLTYDYEWNLTKQFNESLIKHGVPTCPTPTTVTTTSTTPPQYDFANTSVVAKCFVCGLKNLGIPREAFCADAFAGDFLPLVPVDQRARGQIASFRKYCRFLDVHNYVENPSEPRSIYGRFTGGCGVRWTDLSGIYTQRTCRNRYKPLMGKHFASKRMAKLELALINVENGCIISPMASLLPLSRGISLYARFHACVCTGNWCNSAVTAHPWNVYITILWYILINAT